jgi:hypothetical protein
MINTTFEILNQRGTPMFFSDTLANRPVAAIVGRIFISTDTNEIYRDTGSNWNLLSGGGGGSIGGTIATGQVAFGSASNTIAGTNNLFWDNTNARLGIGTNTPQTNIQISDNKNGITSLQISNTTAGLVSQSGIRLDSDASSGTMNLGKYSSTSTTYLSILATDGYLSNANFGDITLQNEVVTGRIKFSAGGVSTPQMTIFSNGNVGIGGGLTDAGQKFQVTGTSNFVGNITLPLNQNAASGLTISNSTSGTAANSFLKLQTTNASTYGEFTKLSSAFTTFKIFVANDLAIFNANTSGDIAILNDFATGNIKFAAGGSSIAQFTLASTGATTFTRNMSLTFNQNGQTLLNVSNTTSGTTSIASIRTTSSNGYLEHSKQSATTTAYKILLPNDSYFYNVTSGDIAILNDFTTGNIKFAAGGSTTAQMTLLNTGNLHLGGTTDTGERLQVTGNSKFNASTGTLFLVQNSALSPVFYLQTFGGTSVIGFSATIFQPDSVNASVELNATGNRQWNVTGNKNNTSGTTSAFFVTSGFNPTSGNGIYNALTINPTINQTGGANGITRGLIINPTLTAATDFRAIEWSNNTGFGLYGVGTCLNYLNGNLLLGSTTNSVTNERLQITGTQITTDTRTYSTGTIQSSRDVKNLTFPNGSTIPGGGNTIITSLSVGTTTFQGSITIPNTNVFSTTFAANEYSITSAGVTITSTQAVGSRTISQNIVQNQFSGTNSGTFTHVSSSQILGYYNNNTGTITPTITNAYQLLINDINDYGHTFTLTNRWGIYQEGANDRNYLAGNLLIGNNTDSGQKLQVNGNAIVYGKLLMSAGTTSNAQINLATSTAPTSPNNGDIWFDGTNLFMRIGGVTKTFTII